MKREANASARPSTASKSKKVGRGPGRPFSDEKFDGREQLLASAHQLLIESHGLPVSMNYVCERAGVNQAMVRYHFGGKHELMVALFERVSSSWVDPINELMSRAIEPTKKLEIHIRQIIRNYRSYPYISRLMTELQLTSDRKLQKRLSKSYVDHLLDFYKRVIDEGVESGTLKPVEPLYLFLSIIGLCEYVFAVEPMLEAGLGIKIGDEFESGFVNHTVNLVLNGLKEN